VTLKQSHLYDFWWNKLLSLCAQKGEAVTAGELARFVGQSRATCQKYLNILRKEKAVSSGKVPHWNGVKKTVYFPIGEGK